jgi:hypothetical protein
VGEVLAMQIRPGVFFEPEVIGRMGEALETACKLLPDASQHEIVRKSWPDELLQRPVLVSATPFAYALSRLRVTKRNWLKRAACLTLANRLGARAV